MRHIPKGCSSLNLDLIVWSKKMNGGEGGCAEVVVGGRDVCG